MKSVLRLVSSVVILAAALLLAACGKEAAGGAAKSAGESFPIRVGDRTVRLQIAALPAELQQGLMFRQTLAPDDGMLFLFTSPQRLSFYMRNTTVPLDIGYFDAAGELREIYPMYPLDERSVTSRSRSLQFALEMNQGWFAANGVRPGAKLDLPAVAAALRARGLKPEAAGLP
jgi:uncharacterized membrane protein (UPF0127 family)